MIGDHIADIRLGRLQKADTNREVFFETMLDMGEHALPCLDECYEALQASLMDPDLGGVLDEEAVRIGAANTIIENLAVVFHTSDSAQRYETMQALTNQMRNRYSVNDSTVPDPLVAAFQRHFPL